MKNQWEFPLYPIPDTPNANGVVYPNAILERAVENIQGAIQANRFFAHQLRQDGQIQVKDMLGINTAIAVVNSIQMGTEGKHGIVRLTFLPSYEETVKDCILILKDLCFGCITASTLTGFFDRRAFPSGTKMVVEEIQQIYGIHPIRLSNKEHLVISEEQIVQESKRP